MRASCMLHLPGLIMTKRINHILQLISKLSFTTRGFLGEGTQAVGNFFQISAKSFFVISPGFASLIFLLSISITGITSAAVPVKKHSSAT